MQFIELQKMCFTRYHLNVRIDKPQQTHILVMTMKVLVYAEKIKSGDIKCLETYWCLKI